MYKACPRFKVTMHDSGRLRLFRATTTSESRSKIIGRLETSLHQNEHQVVSILVNPGFQRCGIGTKLYEAAAKFGCENNAPLQSDTHRTDQSQGFWAKQAAKGRAKCLRTVNEFPTRPDYPSPKYGRGGCSQYALTCPAPASLAGARKRKPKRDRLTKQR